MWGEWRLTLRKAEHALKIGRIEDAVTYVTRPEVASYRQARDLAVRVAQALADRAMEHLRQDDSQRAWHDLERAERLSCLGERLAQLRQEIVQRAIQDAVKCLNGGKPESAISVLDQLKRRGVNGQEVGRLRDAAVCWRLGSDQARAGRLGPAIERLERARSVLADCEPLVSLLEQAWAARDRLPPLEAELHRALGRSDDAAVLATADEILTIAPDHLQARAARRQAWRAVGAPVSGIGNGNGNRFAHQPLDLGTVLRDPNAPPITEEDEQPEPANIGAGPRFLLWVDGVGGYLVCLGDRVSLGQPAGWHVDVPIMADLSRLHAWIERDGEGYVVRAVRPASVNGCSVREKAVLGSESEVMLGHGVRLRFRRTSPLSRAARLELTSPHRMSLPAEAVILMAETFIIGPSPAAHVQAPQWTRELVFYRQDDELWIRTPGEFEVDGRKVRDRARIELSSRVRGEGFSLALEPLNS